LQLPHSRDDRLLPADWQRVLTRQKLPDFRTRLCIERSGAGGEEPKGKRAEDQKSCGVLPSSQFAAFKFGPIGFEAIDDRNPRFRTTQRIMIEKQNNRPPKILTVFGTRPEAIKLAPIIQQGPAMGATVITCTTGQHREMLDQVLDLFDICPDHDLRVMQPNQDLASLTARILSGVSKVLSLSSPDMVLVQGDTATAFAAALAAFYAKIPVGHVEAGLRTYDLYSPFPEEAMRQMITRVARWHFAPTEQSARNLIREGVSEDRVFVTGNTVIDALLKASALIRAGQKVHHLQLSASAAGTLGDGRRLVLITGHRRENFGEAFERVCQALRDLALSFPDTVFIYPVHMNPNVRQPVQRILQPVENIHLIEPVNYYTFVHLMQRAYLIISDSGGVQEEAPSLGRPVFVTRQKSERMEIVETGAVKLVGTDPKTITTEVAAALLDRSVYESMLIETNPYGDGNAAQRILNLLLAPRHSAGAKEEPHAAVPGR
jgi:UDP-N-acetylglucosamine 2-epimerase (non-hydrolysing)